MGKRVTIQERKNIYINVEGKKEKEASVEDKAARVRTARANDDYCHP
jgi:hypothetical protein